MISKQENLLTFAVSLARIAEAEIMPRYLSCTVMRKPDGTEVTEADRLAESAVRKAISEQFPDHGILGEEWGESPSDSCPYRWIIDPLDGTAAFTLGMPTFGVLIGLELEREPFLGVIHFPVIGETVFAARGEGCWFQTRGQKPERVTTAPVDNLGQAVVSASGVHCSDIQHSGEQTPYRLSQVIDKSSKFRFVGDCLQHALVCRGRVHVAIDTLMSPWDTAALIPCILEAGGVATDLSGNHQNVVSSGSLITSACAPLHEEVLSILSA